MKINSVSVLMAVGALGFVLPVHGDEAADRFRLDVSVDLTNAYYYRGLLQERGDWIVQPEIELGYTISDPDDDVEVEAFIGVWNSIHSLPTAAETSDDIIEHWYELDVYPGISFSNGPWSVSAIYWYQISPSDAFDRLDEIELSLAYDDSGTDDFALNPWAAISFEIAGAPSSGDDRGIYAAIGVEPGVALSWFDDDDVSLSFPLTVGFSIDDFYQNDDGDNTTLGYVDLGVEAAMPWPGCEHVEISAGAHWLHVEGAVRELNEGRADEFVGRVGVSISF